MIKKPATENYIYPCNGWELIEEKFTIENNARNETMFTLGNGYIGLRGNFEEGYNGPEGTGLDGTYINGFYEREIIKYPEIAYGYAEKTEIMLNVTNSKIIKLFVEDEEFSMLNGTIEEYERKLSMKDGILTRKILWSSPKGKKIMIKIERLVSMVNKHILAIQYEVVPLNFTGKVRLITALDGNVSNVIAGKDPRIGSGLQGRALSVIDKQVQDDFAYIVSKTRNSELTLVCAMENRLKTSCVYTRESIAGEFFTEIQYTIDVATNEKVSLSKFVSYATSRDYNEGHLNDMAVCFVSDASKAGFEKLKCEHIGYMQKFWDKTDIEINGDVSLQQGIRINMLHLLQSVGRDGKTNIGAKGLTGEGYDGHYFWDTEMYILPFFLYNNPEISRKLLEYRYMTLDKARKRARQMSHNKGALFPWRTITGEECSSYYPASTAQYHVDADVAFAVKRYMDATNDQVFLEDYGAELLFETARLFADLGRFIPRKNNKFCINGVTGPDEYTAIVDNNCFTNLMAKENLLNAYSVARWMKEYSSEKYDELVRRIGLEESEVEFWLNAAENMYIPYDETERIYKQDDSFLEKPLWDFENTPEDKFPLLLHYHYLVIYRHQVAKQADVIFALLLLGDKFSIEEKKRNFDYYEKVTTHDSSLSTAIFSVVACEIGYFEKAYDYFMCTARTDLDDYQGNTKDGIHAANMAGSWMCLVNAFAGMRVFNEELSFKPYLPEKWENYNFKVVFRNRVVKVTVNRESTCYELLKGTDLQLKHFDKQVDMKTGQKAVIKNERI